MHRSISCIRKFSNLTANIAPKKWRKTDAKSWKGRKPWVVDPRLLSPNEPISGSAEFGDMEKARRFEFDAKSLNARGSVKFY